MRVRVRGCRRRCNRPAPPAGTEPSEGSEAPVTGAYRGFLSWACVRSLGLMLKTEFLTPVPPSRTRGSCEPAFLTHCLGEACTPEPKSASCPEGLRWGALSRPLDSWGSARLAPPILGSLHHRLFPPAPPSERAALLMKGEPAPGPHTSTGLPRGRALMPRERQEGPSLDTGRAGCVYDAWETPPAPRLSAPLPWFLRAFLACS